MRAMVGTRFNFQMQLTDATGFLVSDGWTL